MGYHDWMSERKKVISDWGRALNGRARLEIAMWQVLRHLGASDQQSKHVTESIKAGDFEPLEKMFKGEL